MIVPEYWVDIPGSLRYQVSNYGNICRKLKNGEYKTMTPYCRKNKWRAVKVDFKGKYKEYYVHHIVASAFLEPPCSGQILHHKNELIRDNYAGNLEWIYPSELGRKTGGKTSRVIPVVKIDPKTNEVINFYKSISAAARENYIHKETISLAVRGRIKTAAGFKWRKERIDEAI